MIDIKDISGKIRCSIEINSGSKGKFTLMKEDYVILPFSVQDPIYFKLGDNIDFAGILDDSLGGKLSKIYELVDLYKPTFNASTGGYDYELHLDAYYWKWKNKKFKYTPEHGGREASWNLTATLDVHLNVFLRNLKSFGYKYRGNDFTYSIDSTVSNTSRLVSYSNTNMIDALTMMAETWGCEWWVTDNVIHFGRCEFGDAVELHIGAQILNMSRTDSSGTFATRIYAFGSTKNIPENYRPLDEQIVVNGVVQKRLMLPEDTPYIDAYENMSEEEAVEAIITFDDVFPHKVGTLSDVQPVERTEEVEQEDGSTVKETYTVYQYKDTELDFSSQYILPGQELKIIFQSGSMNGMEFGVTFNPENKEPEEQLWEIVRNENYGRFLPDDILHPKDGDTYVLSGFDTSFVSDTMIPEAEQELKERAIAYSNRSKIDDGTYPTTLDSEWVYGDLINRTYGIGQRVNVFNPAYFEDGRISRVLGFEFNLDIPYDSPIYTIGESSAYSRLGEIESKLDNITYSGQSYIGAGGSGGSGSIYIIRTNDSTPASDDNVFSALRSLATFLRKDRADSTKYLLSLLGGALCDNLESRNFAAGPFGTGYVLKQDKKTGHSYLEIDELYVRLKAYFDTLEIKHLSHVGGRIVISPASMECDRVEVMSGEFEQLFDSAGDIITDSNGEEILAKRNAAGSKFYRCYFKQKDDEKEIVNEFAVGDQAQCREFNVKTGISHNVSNQYYWRKVIAVGEDYIDLSVTDCDPISMEPKAGDTIVTIGNDRDINRQNVIVLSSYDNDAPSIKQYAEINSYSMLNKEVTVLSPFGNKFTGKMVIQNGSTGYENFEDKPDLDGIRQDASDALQAASDAQDSVNDAMNAVSDLNEYVDGAFADGIITEAEAQAIEKYINTVNSTKQEVESTYNVLYANTYLQGTAKTNLLNAKITFMGKVEELINAINIAIEDRQTTVEEKQNVDRKFDEFNDAYADMSKAIEDANKSIQDVLKSYSDEAKDMISSVMGQIGKVDQATKDEMAKLLGFTDFAQLEEWAQTGRTIISGGMINTRLIKADAIVTTALIASAIRANTLNVNNKFIVKTDGSVDMSGILHSLGVNTELVISDGYVRILYKGSDVARFSVNEDTGQPEIDMKWGTKSLHASPSDLTFGLGNGDALLLDPARIGKGIISKDENNFLIISEGYREFFTVTLSSSPKEGGTTKPFAGPSIKEKGYRETISAVPNEGYRFDRWSDGGSQTHDVVWQQDVNITAYFVKEEEDYFTVTTQVSPADGGTVTGGGSYPPGKSVQLIAKANSGYVFSQWDDGVTTIDRYITVNKNYDLTAYFIKDSSQEGNLLLINDSKYFTILQGSESDFSLIGEVVWLIARPTPSGMILAINKGYLQNKLRAGKRYRFSMKIVGGKGTGKIITLVGAFNPSYPNDLDNFNFVGDDAIKPLYNIPSTTSDPGYGTYEFTFTADRTSTMEDSVIFVMEFGGSAITGQSSVILCSVITLEAL